MFFARLGDSDPKTIINRLSYPISSKYINIEKLLPVNENDKWPTLAKRCKNGFDNRLYVSAIVCMSGTILTIRVGITPIFIINMQNSYNKFNVLL